MKKIRYIWNFKLQKTILKYGYFKNTIYILNNVLYRHLDNDVETIWTKRINKDVKADEVIYGIIGTQIKFENITNVITSMRRPVFLRRMELFAIRLDLCKFYLMNRQYFTNDQIENFELVYGVHLEDFLEKFELKLDNIKSLEEFKQVLLDIKDSYIGAFRK